MKPTLDEEFEKWFDADSEWGPDKLAEHSLAKAAWDAGIEAWKRREPLQVRITALEKQIEREREAHKNMEEAIFGTESGSAEEFFLRDLAVWALIDEVLALRRGIGLTHVGEDPITRLTDKWLGISPREHATKTLEHVRKVRADRASLRTSETTGEG